MDKNYFIPLLINVLSISFNCFSNVSATEISLVADEWCPYNCTPSDANPGFMVEIAQYGLAKAGYTVNYKIVPWTRAINEVRQGKYHGIIGAGKEETPDFVFPKQEQGQASHTFFVLKNNAWRYQDLASLASIRLGVIQDYSYGNLYQNYILPHQQDRQKVQILSGDTALAQNIKKLQKGRIDAIIESKTVFEYHLFSTGTPNKFAPAGVAYRENVYVAFSPAKPQSVEYARLLTDGMLELRRTGELAKILKKYGVTDWK
jgi:polar amino acid transport system substrate-binding protein